MPELPGVRYLMIHNGKRHWLTEEVCARALNGPWIDGGMALDLDTFVERPLTEAEKDRITRRSHESSANK